MKKIFILSLLAASLSLQGCYEDKGNYNYSFDKINSVTDVEFLPEPYTGGTTPITTYDPETSSTWQIDYVIPSATDTIEARINVSPITANPSSTANLEYTWYRTYLWDEQEVRDTMHTQGYIDVLFPGNNSITYNMTLKIRETENDIAYYVPLIVRTRELYTNSLFVLHGNAVGSMHLGNVEFLDNTPVITTDAYAKVHPEENVNPFAMSCLLGFRVDFRAGAELLAFNTNGTADIFNPFGLVRKYPNTWAMPQTTGAPFITKEFLNYSPSSNGSDFRVIVSTDGRFYTSRTMFRFFEPGVDSDSPEHLTPDQYTVTTCVQTEDYDLLYDSKNARFLYLSRNNGSYPTSDLQGRDEASMTSPVLDAKVLTNMLVDKYQLAGKEFVYSYISYFDNLAAGQDSRFIFYNPQTKTNFMYQLSPTNTKGDKSTSGEEEGTFRISQYSELVDVRLEPGTPIIYNPTYTLDFIFYADEGAVYRYNVANGDKELIYEAPEGYVIKVLKFRQNDNYYGRWDKLSKCLCIGMNKNTEGAVAEIRLTTAGDIDTSWEPQLYEGFENIQDIQFCNELLWDMN